MIKNGILALIILAGFFRIIQWLLAWSSFSKYLLNAATALLLFFAFVSAAINTGKRLKLSALDAVVIAFLVHGFFITAVSAFDGRGLFTSLNGFRTYFFGSAVYFLIRLAVTERSSAKAVTAAVMMMLTIIGAELIFEFSIMNILLKDWTVLPWIYQGAMMTFGESPDRVKIASAITDDFLFRPLGLLGYVHYSAYAVGLGVLLLAPYVIFFEKGKTRAAHLAAFAILMAALFLSTTRSIIFLVSALLTAMVLMSRPNAKGLALILVLMLLGAGLAVKLGILTFIGSFLKGEDAFYESFEKSPFSNLQGTNPFDLLIGRGFEPGIYESFNFGDYGFSEYGFHFNQISDQVHILYYMDRTGIIGGALFFLQAAFGFIMASKMASMKEDYRHKRLCTGLAFCSALFFLSSGHILHSDIVMQFFNYTILGITGSLWQAHKRQEAGVIEA